MYKDFLGVNFIKRLFSNIEISGLNVFVILFIIYMISGHIAIISNDAVTNIQQIERYDFYSRSSHFSFHFFGIIFYWLLNTLFGISAQGSVQFMLSFFSAVSSAFLFLTIVYVFNNKRLALITVFIYAFSTSVWRMSIQPEYLILVPSFGIISLYLYVKEKSLLSGISFGFGILTSAFMICFLPAFLLKLPPKERLIKTSALFFVGTIATWVLVNLFTIKETVSGEWSYGYILSYYFDNLYPLRSFLILLYGYFRSFNILIIISLIGLVFLFKNNKKLFLITVGLIIFHIPTIFNEARLGAYQIPAYPFIAICAAYTIDRFWQTKKYVFIVLLLIFIVINSYLILAERTFTYNLATTYAKLQADDSIPDNSIIFVYHAVKPIREIHAPRLNPVDIIHRFHFDKAKGMNPDFTEHDYQKLIDSDERKFIIESGTVPPDDQVKNYFLGFLDKRGVKTKGFAIRTLEPYLEKVELKKLSDYPMDVYEIIKRD